MTAVSPSAEHWVPARPAPTALRPWQVLLIGAGGALVGLLPWLLTGARLPLQNLWADASAYDRMPLVLLPFSQYTVSFVAALLVIGATIAALAARALASRLPRAGFLWLVSGVLLVQTSAIVQTSAAVREGLRDGTESTLYMLAVVAVAITSLVVAALVLWLIARTPRPGALIGIAVAAVLTPSWAGGLLAPIGSVPPDWVYEIVTLLRWIPPVMVGIAIAWCGIRSVGRATAALGALVILWIGPALITGVSSAAGTRVLARDPLGMLEYGGQVFAMAATMPELVAPPILVAIGVAAVGLSVRSLRARQMRVPQAPPRQMEGS